METSLTDSLNLKSKGLTANTIKLIAIAAMLIDHIAWGFVPFGTPLAQVMHIIGRITAPTMCFFIAEGYFHTRNVKKYAARLGIFALISYLPYVIFEAQSWPPTDSKDWGDLNVIYTLFLSLLALWAWDKIQNKGLRIVAVIGLCILSLPGDWMCFAILFTLAFGTHHDDFKKQAFWFSIIAVIMVIADSIFNYSAGRLFYKDFFQLGVFLALPLLANYNGQRGGGKYGKWIFYIFYPAHLLILGMIIIFMKAH